MHHLRFAPGFAAAPLCHAAADSTPGSATNSAKVAEFVTFRLKDGISDAAFVRAADAINPFLRNSGEVISRALSRDDDGLWTDHLVWASMKAAKEVAARVMQQPEFALMGKMIDADNMNLRYARILMQMD